MKKSCQHFDDIKENISPHTQGCEECEKKGTDWVALRLCLICGHVGCCDSSVGRHATNHFKKTGHPVWLLCQILHGNGATFMKHILKTSLGSVQRMTFHNYNTSNN